jgi:ABC-type amino acid transport substrate-binding protein
VFKDPNHLDRNIGFEVDLAEALAHEIGRRIEFV